MAQPGQPAQLLQATSRHIHIPQVQVRQLLQGPGEGGQGGGGMGDAWVTKLSVKVLVTRPCAAAAAV